MLREGRGRRREKQKKRTVRDILLGIFKGCQREEREGLRFSVGGNNVMKRVCFYSGFSEGHVRSLLKGKGGRYKKKEQKMKTGPDRAMDQFDICTMKNKVSFFYTASC